jgi:2-hydroxychromene-2-carboxylate isomerase
MDHPAVEFFWDPVSPYTYLASTQIEALAARSSARLVWKPFLIGKVFEATGNRAPITVPAKGAHLLVDLQRWARHYGVPLTMPKTFPMSTVLALRCAVAAAEQYEAAPFARALMRAYWAEGLDISLPETLAALAAKAGMDGEALLARAGEQPIKDLLRANTEEAARRGAFGAPTFFVGTEMFWGNDRLRLLEDHLESYAG